MSAGGMESGWFYARRGGPPGQQVGPVSWQDLVSYARGGAFGPDDLVWHEQLGDWRPASQIQGLFAAPAPAPMPRPHRRPSPGMPRPPGTPWPQPVKQVQAPLLAAAAHRRHHRRRGPGGLLRLLLQRRRQVRPERGGDPARAVGSGRSGLVRRRAVRGGRSDDHPQDPQPAGDPAAAGDHHVPRPSPLPDATTLPDDHGRHRRAHHGAGGLPGRHAGALRRIEGQADRRQGRRARLPREEPEEGGRLLRGPQQRPHPALERRQQGLCRTSCAPTSPNSPRCC